MSYISGISETGAGNTQQPQTVSASTDPQLFAQMLKAQMDASLLGAGLGSSGLGTNGIMDLMLAQAILQKTEDAAAAQTDTQPETVQAAEKSYSGLHVSRVYTPDVPIGASWPQHTQVHQNAAISAMTRVGDPYSQSKRGTGTYVDCSYLTQWAYKQNGITLPGTAAEQARWCVNNGCVIPKSEIQPGDLVFWQRYGCTCGRYDEIHHVGIYLGDGRVVEASSSRGQVVVNDLWGEEEDGDNWQLAFFARPA